MPTGIIVYNDFGTVVIDNNVKNPVVRSQGTGATDASGMITVTYNAFGPTPLISMEIVPNYYVYLYETMVSGSTYTWRFYVKTSTAGGNPGSGVGIRYWIFDSPSSTTVNYGIEVRNPDTNEVTFSFQEKPLRIPYIYTNPGGAASFSLVGRTYAAIHGKLAGTRTSTIIGQTGTYRVIIRYQGVSNENGNLAVPLVVHTSTIAPTQPPDFNWTTQNIMVADVTNY